jgi:hypothetical protein
MYRYYLSRDRFQQKGQIRVDRSRIDRRRWWTLLTLSLSLLISERDNTVLNVVIPTLQQEFNVSAATRQWMIDTGNGDAVRSAHLRYHGRRGGQ